MDVVFGWFDCRLRALPLALLLPFDFNRGVARRRLLYLGLHRTVASAHSAPLPVRNLGLRSLQTNIQNGTSTIKNQQAKFGRYLKNPLRAGRSRTLPKQVSFPPADPVGGALRFLALPPSLARAHAGSDTEDPSGDPPPPPLPHPVPAATPGTPKRPAPPQSVSRNPVSSAAKSSAWADEPMSRLAT